MIRRIKDKNYESNYFWIIIKDIGKFTVDPLINNEICIIILLSSFNLLNW